jgi:hypothetical protein
MPRQCRGIGALISLTHLPVYEWQAALVARGLRVYTPISV